MNQFREFIRRPRVKKGILAIVLILGVSLAAAYGFLKVLETTENFGPLSEPNDFTEETEPQYHWDLTAMYADFKTASERRERVKSDLVRFRTFEGHLKDQGQFKQAIALYEKIQIEVDSLNVYANLQRDAQTTDQTIDDFAQSIESLQAEMNGTFAFLDQELAAMSTTRLMDYLQLEEAKGSQWLINKAIYERSNIGSKKENYLVSLIEGMEPSIINPYHTFWNRFEQESTGSDYYENYFDKEDSKRYAATEKYLEKSISGAPLLASILENKIQYDNTMAKAYGYESSLAMVLAQDGLDQKAFDRILEINDSRLDLMHRWIRYKKNALKLERPYAFYDVQLSLTEEPSLYPFKVGASLVRDSLQPLGPDALNIFDRAIEERWIDVYPQEGKTDANYTWGAYGSHPYVFLNYEDHLESVDTLAHEMGHAIHSQLTNQSQSFENASFGVFKAEIASTTNEVLFLEHAVNTLEGDARKEAQIEYVSLFANTLFEQLKATEFEIALHEAAARGENLNDAFLVKTWRSLNKKYYGEDYQLGDFDGYEWTKLDHLYWNFYMYKYATGLSSGYEIAQKLITVDENTREAYLAFLKSGSSTDVFEELSDMGISLENGDHLSDCYDKMDKMLSELERSIK